MDGIHCDVCKSIDDVETPAVGSCNECTDNLCELCFTNHKRNRMTRNHVLEHKPSQSKSLTRPTSPGNAKTICQEHQQDISIFCKLHDAVGCSVCMKMYHLFCHQSNISDVALGIGNTKETEKLKCDIDGLRKTYKDTMQRSKDQIADIEKNHTNAVKAIKETMDRLKQLQHKSENEVAHIKDTDITKMKSVTDNCEEMLNQIDILGAELDFDGDTIDDKCMFIKVKQVKPKIEPINNHLKQVQYDNKITRYEFTTKTIYSATHDMKALGKVSREIQLSKDVLKVWTDTLQSSTSLHKLIHPGSTASVGDKVESKPFNWQGTEKPLFGGWGGGHKEIDGGIGDRGGNIQHGDGPHFEPIIPLPDLVEVKTGEEDETLEYNHRAKLYRYDKTTNQWKEKGVGEMKILKHKETGKYRLLMRREQVHKLVCNHLLTPDLILTPMNTSETSWCWTAQDFSEDEPKVEQLAIKFKTIELAKTFKDKFEEIQSILKDE